MPRMHPPPAPRNASDHYDEMAAIASIAVPEWSGAGRDGEFGYALLKVLATMAERTGVSISKTGLRDAIAFFNYLDVPAEPQRSATSVIAFQLTEKQPDAVDAPAGVQIGATTDGEEQIFETTAGVHIVQSRLDLLAAVDNGADRIELAPPGFLDFEPEPSGLTQFTVPTLTPVGSKELQVEPPEGLEEGDYVRFTNEPRHTAVYRLGEGKDGLFALVDPLEQEVDAGATLEKITRLEAFRLRDVQRHRAYIGHKDLLNLEQPSAITVTIEPAGVAAQMDGIVTWQIYGTRIIDDAGNESTDWQPLLAATAADGAIVLTKTWSGSVDEFDEPGEKNRWLRATWPQPITDRAQTLSARTIRLSVRSLGADDSAEAVGDDACCKTSDDIEPAEKDQREPDVDRSISQAFYNSLPLPLTTRFYPFGPEPQRFDTFAFAAPEALSKKGAAVVIRIAVSDASPAVIAVNGGPVGGANGPRRAYAVGGNGQLQTLNFETTTPDWEDVGAPGADDRRSGAEPATADQLLIDVSRSLHAKQWAAFSGRVYDAVVVQDVGKRLWLYAATWSDSGGTLEYDRGAWSEFAAPDATIVDFVSIYREPAAGTAQIIVVAIVGNELKFARALGGAALGLRSRWDDVTGAGPVLNRESIIVAAEPVTWPAPSPAEQPRIVVLDEDGKLWAGTLDVVFNANPPPVEVAVTWVDSGETLSQDVRPVAWRTAANELRIAGATADINSVLRPKFITIDAANNVSTLVVNDVALMPSAKLAVDPTGFGDNGARIATTGTRNGNESLLQFRNAVLHAVEQLPADVANGAALATFLIDALPVVALGGATENLLVQLLPDPVDVVAYRDALVLKADQVVGGFLERPGQNAPQDLAAIPAAADAVIVDGEVRVFPFPVNPFQTGAWKVWEATGSVRLRRPAGPGVPDEEMQLVGAGPPPPANSVLEGNGKRYTMVGAAQDVDPDPAVEDWRLTLDSNVSGLPAGNLDFQILTARDDAAVGDEHRQTLLEITDIRVASGKPDRLVFNSTAPTANPPSQQLAHEEFDGTTLWALVKSAWTTAPVPGELVEALTTTTNQVEAHAYPRNFQNPELAWEFFDGDGWRRFESGFIDGTENLARTGEIRFTVPASLSPVEIAGKEDHFIRARLIGGDYGRPIYRVESDTSGTVTTQSVTVDTSALQPPEIRSIAARFSLERRLRPERLFVDNNLTRRNQTQAAASDSAIFNLFEGAVSLDDADGRQTGRSLYFGFTRPFGPGPLTIFVDTLDAAGDGRAVVEVLGEHGWRESSVNDRSRAFRQRGFFRVSIETVPVQARRFGEDLYWLRVFLDNGAPDWRPQIASAYINAAPVIQAKTIRQELLGSSSGEPAQSFRLANRSVHPDSLELRVRENLTGEEHEALTRRFGPDAVTRYDDIDLEGDWVRWSRVDSFIGRTATDRVYRLNSVEGTIEFGAGAMAPPAGRDNLRAIGYRSGGGTGGNVAAHTIGNLKSSVRGVDKVTNPVPAAGGTTQPAIADQISGSPALIRRAGRALMPVDIEAMVVANSPDLLRAHCSVSCAPGGGIRLAVLKRGEGRCPVLALSDRTAIRDWVLEAGWGGLLPERVHVDDPAYVPVRVQVKLAADRPDNAADLRAAASAALLELLDPVNGGPGSNGWPFGRPLWRSDVQRALGRLAHFDVIHELEISRRDNRPMEAMPPTGIVCGDADDIDVSVVLNGSRTAAEAQP